MTPRRSTCATLSRFYYTIPPINRFKLVLAYSKLDALARVADSEDMRWLQHIKWLN